MHTTYLGRVRGWNSGLLGTKIVKRINVVKWVQRNETVKRNLVLVVHIFFMKNDNWGSNQIELATLFPQTQEKRLKWSINFLWYLTLMLQT